MARNVKKRSSRPQRRRKPRSEYDDFILDREDVLVPSPKKTMYFLSDSVAVEELENDSSSESDDECSSALSVVLSDDPPPRRRRRRGASTTTRSRKRPKKPALREPGVFIESFYEDPTDALDPAPTRRTRPSADGPPIGDVLYYGDECVREWPYDIEDELLKRGGLRTVCSSVPGRSVDYERPVLDVGEENVDDATRLLLELQAKKTKRSGKKRKLNTEYVDEMLRAKRAQQVRIENAFYHFGTLYSCHSPLWVVFGLGDSDASSTSIKDIVDGIAHLVEYAKLLAKGHSHYERVRFVLLGLPSRRGTTKKKRVVINERLKDYASKTDRVEYCAFGDESMILTHDGMLTDAHRKKVANRLLETLTSNFPRRLKPTA